MGMMGLRRMSRVLPAAVCCISFLPEGLYVEFKI